MKSLLETPLLVRSCHCLWICVAMVASRTSELAQPITCAVMLQALIAARNGARQRRESPKGGGVSSAEVAEPGTHLNNGRDQSAENRHDPQRDRQDQKRSHHFLSPRAPFAA